MTKEEVLQKVNEYCTEKQYTEETLTSEFKDNFSKFFATKYGDDTAIDAEGVFEDIKFNLNTAFNAASKGITTKQTAYAAKEKEFEEKIAELNKKLQQQKPEFNIPEDLKKEIEELKKFKADNTKKEARNNIIAIAKEGIRPDLHGSFDEFAADFVVADGEDAEAQATKLVEKFEKIFKSSIGSIKPLSPKQVQNMDAELLKGVMTQKL
jgi:hypothetical protein